MNSGDVKLFDEAFKKQMLEDELELREQIRCSKKRTNICMYYV